MLLYGTDGTEDTRKKQKNTYDVHVAKPRRCSSVRHMQKNKEGGWAFWCTVPKNLALTGRHCQMIPLKDCFVRCLHGSSEGIQWTSLLLNLIIFQKEFEGYGPFRLQMLHRSTCHKCDFAGIGCSLKGHPMFSFRWSHESPTSGLQQTLTRTYSKRAVDSEPR